MSDKLLTGRDLLWGVYGMPFGLLFGVRTPSLVKQLHGHMPQMDVPYVSPDEVWQYGLGGIVAGFVIGMLSSMYQRRNWE